MAYTFFAYDYNASEYAWLVHADQNYSKGEEVFISYGLHGNSIMLHHYNVVLRDNPSEEVTLFLDQLAPGCPFHLAWAGKDISGWGPLCQVRRQQ